jgi:hypothetical protein
VKPGISSARIEDYGLKPTSNRTQFEQTSEPTSTVSFKIATTSNRVGQRAGVAVSQDRPGAAP